MRVVVQIYTTHNIKVFCDAMCFTIDNVNNAKLCTHNFHALIFSFSFCSKILKSHARELTNYDMSNH